MWLTVIFLSTIVGTYIENAVQNLCERSVYDLWWIGATDRVTEGVYRWVDGTSVAAEVFSWFQGMETFIVCLDNDGSLSLTTKSQGLVLLSATCIHVVTALICNIEKGGKHVHQ